MDEAIAARTATGDPTFTFRYRPELLPEPGGRLDMWRYRRLLPGGGDDVRYPLAVGGTPLRPAPHLRAAVGAARLWLKDETTGPTASNKDRATALVIEAGLRQGATVVTTSSTGNAAIATAVGAAAAGIAAVIFVAEDCRPGKVEHMVAAGAHVFKVRGGYRAAFDLSRAAAARFGWIDRNTGVNPVTIEAKKTVAFEVWEQLGRHAPDVAVVPVGDGPTLVGLAKGFRELLACGAIGALPRIIGVQARACAPLADRWSGDAGADPDPAATAADGIAVPVPSIGDWTLAEVRTANGAFVTVTEPEIDDAVRCLLDLAQVRSEPAGAAALAGFRSGLATGLISPEETAVVLVTGADLPVAPAPGTRPGSAHTISADLDAVAAVMSGRPGLSGKGAGGGA
ncbi:pyridoxal-phosphate dependent enzyme [Actinoplanes sp. L3-i22]|uniref:threonine synthase n=1 Tax=Actinoplanes sp. L3-i22 TaxID=2836373 RepID=UPI001C85D647|nr:pyridoxal-phosphate dependent enzyme [Actinoplanes sp. L3-i22]